MLELVSPRGWSRRLRHLVWHSANEVLSIALNWYTPPWAWYPPDPRVPGASLRPTREMLTPATPRAPSRSAPEPDLFQLKGEEVRIADLRQGPGRLRLARHEAGHAVVAQALGWRIVALTLDESGGCCYSRPGIRVRPAALSGQELLDDRQLARASTVWDDATITLAGIAAEWIATGAVLRYSLPERQQAIADARSHTAAWQPYLAHAWRHAHGRWTRRGHQRRPGLQRRRR